MAARSVQYCRETSGVSDNRDSPPSQSEWLRLAADVIDAAMLRADARRNVLTIARCLGWSASWHTGRTRPTVARLMEVSGLSRRCVQGWLRWLERHELLDVLEPGTTAQYRPAVLALDSPNLAREWRLRRPGRGDVDATCTPTGSLGFHEDPPRARARPGPFPYQSTRVTRGWTRQPQTRSEALEAARAMQHRAPALRAVSPEHLRHVLRPWFAAGYSPADVLYALDHDPDGRQHGYTTAIRYLPGWLRSRLELHLVDGRPVASRSQQLDEQARQVRAEQAARTVARTVAAERAAEVDVAARAGQLRAIVAEVRLRQRARMTARPGIMDSWPPAIT